MENKLIKSRRVGDGSVTVRSTPKREWELPRGPRRPSLPKPLFQPTLQPQRKLYLAYGSNLNWKIMRERCPDAEPVRTKSGKPKIKLLKNARLVFRGVADLDLVPEARVPCGLWWITSKDEEALDRYEGEGIAYQKFSFSIWLDPDKRDQAAIVYMMKDRIGVHRPSMYYMSLIRDGYRNFNIDEAWLNEAFEHSVLNKNHSEQTRARRARQKKNSLHEKLVPIPEWLQRKRIELELAAAEAKEQDGDQILL